MAKSKKPRTPDVRGGVDEMNTFLSILSNETDRGTALVGGAYLDAQVAELLCDHLGKDKMVEDVLRYDQPLGTYSARCKMAYLLKLISQEEYNLLKLIGEIRNGFAHNVLDQTFEAL